MTGCEECKYSSPSDYRDGVPNFIVCKKHENEFFHRRSFCSAFRFREAQE